MFYFVEAHQPKKQTKKKSISTPILDFKRLARNLVKSLKRRRIPLLFSGHMLALTTKSASPRTHCGPGYQRLQYNDKNNVPRYKCGSFYFISLWCKVFLCSINKNDRYVSESLNFEYSYKTSFKFIKITIAIIVYRKQICL